MATCSGASTYGNMQQLGSSIGTKMRTLAHHGRPVIEIDLDNSHGIHGKWVTSYSTMDTIVGTVSVTANHDTPLEDIEVFFMGKQTVFISSCLSTTSSRELTFSPTGESHAFVDRLTATPSISGRTEVTHRFLTLKQPIDLADLPRPRKLLANKKYTFPFTFTVPAQLLPRACSHSVSNDGVKASHMMLPPSMGDPEVSGFGNTLLDDLAPEMSRIIYTIRARVMHTREADGFLSVLADKTKKVRIKPAFEEQPPLSISDRDPEYRLRQEKTIRKGLFKGKSGTLTAQSAQPKALVIPGARTTYNSTITTVAKVLLRFDPTDDSSTPPTLGSVVSKIKISTYYASEPRRTFPVRSSIGYDSSQGVYQETLPLSSLCVASAQWKKHSASSNPLSDISMLRRDSGISDCSTFSSDEAFNAGVLKGSQNYRGSSFYTAQISVPITLPENKNFLPTFHSCLISRTYALSLQISAHTPGISDASLHLKIPVQICAEGSETGNENARARSAEAFVSREADDYFTPRSTAPRISGSVSSGDLPPEYAAFASVGRMNQRISAVA
jgi:hypothetical protein